jgi:lactate dehydrogenase-like 2-hydroxyacid dehydrogenase
VKDALRQQVLASKAADVMYDRANKVDNVIGSGAGLDEMPSDLGLAGVAGTLDAQGNTADGTPAPIPGPSELKAAMIKAASRLKLIVRLGSLTEGIDLEAARAKGVRISVQPVVGAIFVAEHLIMMILAVLKHLGRSLAVADSASSELPVRRTDENTFAFNWLGFNDIGGLYDKTVAILGMGEIGVELARRPPFAHRREGDDAQILTLAHEFAIGHGRIRVG